MANDEVLIARVRDQAPPGLVEKNVFGARCWVLDGNLAFGVHDDDLLVRVGDGPAGSEAAAQAGTRPFDPMGMGKAMKGWLLVEQDVLAEEHDLQAWMDRGFQYAAALPPK